jgi:hypothetical protein
MSEGGDEGADEELQYVDVANLSSEGKPRIINPVF